MPRHWKPFLLLCVSVRFFCNGFVCPKMANQLEASCQYKTGCSETFCDLWICFDVASVTLHCFRVNIFNHVYKECSDPCVLFLVLSGTQLRICNKTRKKSASVEAAYNGSINVPSKPPNYIFWRQFTFLTPPVRHVSNPEISHNVINKQELKQTVPHFEGHFTLL